MALFNFKRRSRKLRYFSANSSGWISDFSDKISGFIKSLKSLGLVKVLIYLAVILLLIVATLFAWYSKDLPNPYKFSSRTVSESTKILDRSGQLLYDVHGEKNRTLISFDQMPEYIKKATIAIEDKDFYHHSGFDVRGIIRALYNNLLHKDVEQGGSTITQQLVKNAILSSEKTLGRKIPELIMAIELEKIYSKDEILKMYLNEIPYGNNAYGIQAASQTYLGKDAKDLTLAESAFLAAIPKGPTYYNPYGSHTDDLEARKNLVLDKMTELNYITTDKRDAAKKEKVRLSENRTDIKAAHFVMYVKEKLAEEYGEKMLEEGGLVVTTTLDLEKQKIAEETLAAARKNLNAYGASNASLVSLDPRTGQILAMAGSLDYFDKTIDGNVNVSTRLRQPGSSIKPIIYATAFKEGYYPATMLLDVETDFGQNYKPKNYDGRFHGVVSMRTALGNSLNIPAVKTLFLAGVKNSCDLAQEMGISSLTDPDRYGLSLVLGGGEVQLLELTGAYGVFANQGKKAAVTPFLKIETNKGQVLKEYKEDPKEVLDPQVAYLINNVLSDDSARAMTFGMGGILTLPGRPVAAKTGTTDEYRDAWTIGYTPSLVTGVWAGNNDNSEMAGHAAGAMAAAPIWNTFMKKALSGSPVEQFDRPSSIKTIAVEAQTGKLPLGNIPDALKDEYKIKNEVFASFALPKDVDDVHVVKKIIKGSTNLATGTKLAADNCPQGLAEYKIYSIFHSEKPEMPNWENAVLTWATNSGYNELPQDTEDCDEFIKRNQPELKITSPKDGDTATGTLGVEISTTAPLGVAKVDYLLDEELIASSIAAPFSLSYEIPDVVAGKRTLKAKLFDTVGLTAEASIDLNLKIDTTKPKIILEQKSENDSQVLFLATTSSPAGDEVGKVQFYLNGVLLDSVTSNTNGKYEYSWEKSKNPGSYSFYATAVTNGGVTKKSNLLVVNIAPADNQSADDQKKESDNSKIIETPTATSDPSSNPLSSLENLNH